MAVRHKFIEVPGAGGHLGALSCRGASAFTGKAEDMGSHGHFAFWTQSSSAVVVAMRQLVVHVGQFTRPEL
jgi:hypothetical protein